MDKEESFGNSTCEDQVNMAERELSAFMLAVTELFGPEQARLSAEDWLDESEQMDSPQRATSRDWRAVTVTALARLATGGLQREIIERLPHRPIRRCRRYYRPIVSHPRFWCDASSQWMRGQPSAPARQWRLKRFSKY